MSGLDGLGWPNPEDEPRSINPGSDEAIKRGCKCPVMDNARGRGYMGMEGVYVMNESCPIHGSCDQKPTTPQEVEGEDLYKGPLEGEQGYGH